MRIKLKTMLTITLFVGCVFQLVAQEIYSDPFWVIEGNVKNPRYTIIRFYSNDGLLLQEEKLDGKLLNIRRKKNRRFLDKRLMKVVRNQEEQTAMNKQPSAPSK